ncbi:MAG: HAMP domain-containing sensor histidine kinase [Bacteroidota bacterium]
MNLLTKTTLIYVIIILAVFTFGGFLSFQIFQKEVNKETDYHLRGQLNFITEVIEKGAPIHTLNYNKLQIQPFDSVGPINTKRRYSDTLVLHDPLNRVLPHRKLKVATKVGETWYNISLYESLVEEDDIMDSVTSSLSYTFAILVTLLIISSVFISTWIFRPFKKTLKEIEQFRIHAGKLPDLERTHVKEFSQLNSFLSGMMEKSRRDYLNLKEFIENSAHELQTPLAIARGKLELLMEHKELDTFQAQQIQGAYNALTKLSKLNRSLGLLSKIDNQEFANFKPIDFSDTVYKKVEEFEELISLKELELDTQIDPEVWGEMDPTLLDILLTNLLQNSIKHNYPRGKIELTLEPGSFTITNTGEKLEIAPRVLFQRFKKGSAKSDSHGLGLAIVRKICEVSNMDIHYQAESGLHTITLRFRPVYQPKPGKILTNI